MSEVNKQTDLRTASAPGDSGSGSVVSVQSFKQRMLAAASDELLYAVGADIKRLADVGGTFSDAELHELRELYANVSLFPRSSCFVLFCLDCFTPFF
jgi:hypothetical protein